MPKNLPKELQELIQTGENNFIEFKESKNKIPKEIYKSVCSFSNHKGGHIFLEVKDDGEIIGVNKDKIESLKTDFITTVNNKNRIFPPVIITPEEYEFNDKIILYIRIPESSEVTRLNNRIYTHNNKSDIDATF